MKKCVGEMFILKCVGVRFRHKTCQKSGLKSHLVYHFRRAHGCIIVPFQNNLQEHTPFREVHLMITFLVIKSQGPENKKFQILSDPYFELKNKKKYVDFDLLASFEPFRFSRTFKKLFKKVGNQGLAHLVCIILRLRVRYHAERPVEHKDLRH